MHGEIFSKNFRISTYALFTLYVAAHIFNEITHDEKMHKSSRAACIRDTTKLNRAACIRGTVECLLMNRSLRNCNNFPDIC